MERVHISKCDNYDYENVKRAVYECIDDLEGIHNRLQGSPKVLVKVNLLKKNSPDDAVTTHPAVVEAIVGYLQEKGCRVIIGDSPGGPFTPKWLKGVYEATGMAEVAQKTGCELNYDTSSVEVVNENARRLKSMHIIKVADNVDFVISACKMKTHGMMTYTGAVKNLFGVIPGLIKMDYHFKMNDTENFAEHLLDICDYIKPLFSIMDAVDGMEGDGPSAGEKKHVGLLLSSENPYALDTAAATIMGMTPLTIPTIKAAKDRGLFSGDIKDIEINGVQLREIKVPPFKLPKSISANFLGGRAPKFLERYMLNSLRPRPVFNYDICVSCGDCKRACPAKTIDMSSGKPVVNLDKCIRCFCCHELCPKKAVDIKRHWLYDRVFR